MKKRVGILGSTGSIGTQALEVIENHSEKFEVEFITANNNTKLLIEQAKKFQPNVVVIANEEKYDEVFEALQDEPLKVYTGAEALNQVVEMDSVDVVLTAMVGFSGLIPTINAIKSKKNIALANKETLVVAGDLIKKLVTENNVNIYPVDSEHSAIFQCLTGEFSNPVEKIYLTASGGPFRTFTEEQLANVTKAQALKHPNWEMGAKITIDSATLMNKGLEAIEAKWLFDLQPEQIDIIIHPQSIIHSIAQFEDGSMKAQMGLPDMKLPILYAMAYPNRYKTNFERFNFLNYPSFTFEQPDFKRFPSLGLAFEAMRKGGNMPCILNAANEIAVSLFLDEKIGFMDIPKLVEAAMNKIDFIANPDLEDYKATDKITREFVKNIK